VLRFCFLFLLSTLSVAIGCQRSDPQTQPSHVAPRLAASKLSILVIDDPPLAAGLKLLRGEWAERTGGQIDVQEWTTDQFLKATLVANHLQEDLILYPSRYVGTLVNRNWLRPVRNSVLQNPDLVLDDLFPLVRNATLRYGNQVYALSLGEPPLMIAGSPDQLNDNFPKTWEDFNFPLSPAIKFPRALEFLTRGIAYAKHRSGTADWFDAETMQPRITGPPFIKALQEIVENNQQAVDPQNQLTISWPTIFPTDPATPITFKQLPRANQVYNPVRKTWEPNDSAQPLTFLGFAGRSVSVNRVTRNSASAFKLLTWIVSESIATQLSPRSEATLWFRKSQTRKSNKWLSRDEAEDQTAATLNKLLASNSYYLLPRIPAVDEYLKLLDDAIAKAISEQRPAEKTLAEVTQQWNTLTDTYDRNSQRAAYRKHLGLDEK